jgi:two-component system, chemotaxis family, chemotaxis protein CheY
MVDAFALPTRNSLGRILVVDDEADLRKAVNLALTKSGYEVLEAEDGKMAIETINSDDNPLDVDVIICDVRMPKINGVEAIRYFRDQYPSRPIIVLTGFPDIGLATQLLKQGVSEYLVKPVEREKLAAAVSNVMKKRTRA